MVVWHLAMQVGEGDAEMGMQCVRRWSGVRSGPVYMHTRRESARGIRQTLGIGPRISGRTGIQ